jgi:hypothetical protein
MGLLAHDSLATFDLRLVCALVTRSVLRPMGRNLSETRDRELNGTQENRMPAHLVLMAHDISPEPIATADPAFEPCWLAKDLEAVRTINADFFLSLSAADWDRPSRQQVSGICAGRG